MTINSDRLYVNLGASQVRRRLKGHGFGVKKVETAGKKQAVIIHMATGEHLRQLEALFVSEVKDRRRGAVRRLSTTDDLPVVVLDEVVKPFMTFSPPQSFVVQPDRSDIQQRMMTRTDDDDTLSSATGP
jgi:hypothetical protein